MTTRAIVTPTARARRRQDERRALRLEERRGITTLWAVGILTEQERDRCVVRWRKRWAGLGVPSVLDGGTS